MPEISLIFKLAVGALLGDSNFSFSKTFVILKAIIWVASISIT